MVLMVGTGPVLITAGAFMVLAYLAGTKIASYLQTLCLREQN